jgi:RimJ/RimL family protein N-acetyltransferase
MYTIETRTLTTERLILRPFELSDAECVSKLCNNFNVYKSTLSLPYPYPIESALSWIPTHKENFDNDRIYEFAITDKETGTLYGCMGLSNNQKHKNGEIGYWIGEEYWGKGYASESLTAIVYFAFSCKNYHKVYARHYESNPASGRVMQKAGMIYEGKQADQIYKNNKFETLILYGIINLTE